MLIVYSTFLKRMQTHSVAVVKGRWVFEDGNTRWQCGLKSSSYLEVGNHPAEVQPSNIRLIAVVRFFNGRLMRQYRVPSEFHCATRWMDEYHHPIHIPFTIDTNNLKFMHALIAPP